MTRRAERAFTLLEVMAAVAILGIVYAYLARATSQGILTAGESRWRLEASLVADQVLSDLERNMATDGTLPLGETEFEVDGFAVKQTISPLELPPELLAEDEPDQASRSRSSPGASPASLLAGDGSTPGILRQIRVRVGWFDGVQEQSLVRYSFGYDASAALPLLGLAPEAAAAAGAAAGGQTPGAAGGSDLQVPPGLLRRGGGNLLTGRP